MCYSPSLPPLPPGNRVLDKDKDGFLNLDQLVVFVAEVKKTGLHKVRPPRAAVYCLG
jgi:hypothetical protein